MHGNVPEHTCFCGGPGPFGISTHEQHVLPEYDIDDLPEETLQQMAKFVKRICKSLGLPSTGLKGNCAMLLKALALIWCVSIALVVCVVRWQGLTIEQRSKTVQKKVPVTACPMSVVQTFTWFTISPDGRGFSGVAP